MLRRVVVLRGVLVFRRIAAADMSAGEAQPQVYPNVPHFQTLFAPFRIWFCIVGLLEMFARIRHGLEFLKTRQFP
jgi:hypothetical protein